MTKDLHDLLDAGPAELLGSGLEGLHDRRIQVDQDNVERGLA
jgi:hypothetical protein